MAFRRSLSKQIGLRRRAWSRRHRRGAGLGVGLVEIDGRGGALVPGIARMVDAEVGGDAVEPGAETGLGAVGLARTVDPEEDFLGELFGDGLVVDHAVHEMNDRLAVFLDKKVEAGHIAGCGSSSMMAASSIWPKSPAA